KWVIGIASNEVFDLTQSLGQRRRVREAAIAEEPKAVQPQDAHLLPLFPVGPSWRLERTTHLPQRLAPSWAACLKSGSDLPRPAALETRVRDQGGRARGSLWRTGAREQAVADLAPQFHASLLLGGAGHGRLRPPRANSDGSRRPPTLTLPRKGGGNDGV